MTHLFGLDLPAIVNGALGSSFAAATLHVITPGTRTVGAISSGTNPTTTDYACKGVVSDFALSQVNGYLIQQGDRTVTLLAGSLPSTIEPKTGDRVTIESRTYNVVGVGRDAASAVYHLHVRG